MSVESHATLCSRDGETRLGDRVGLILSPPAEIPSIPDTGYTNKSAISTGSKGRLFINFIWCGYYGLGGPFCGIVGSFQTSNYGSLHWLALWPQAPSFCMNSIFVPYSASCVNLPLGWCSTDDIRPWSSWNWEQMEISEGPHRAFYVGTDVGRRSYRQIELLNWTTVSDLPPGL